MPRTVQDILDNAGVLAARFEDYEPAPNDERDPPPSPRSAKPYWPDPTPNERSKTPSIKPVSTATPGPSSAP